MLLDPPRADPHAAGAPSPWVQRFAAALLRPGCSVLDVACGSGRHLRWLAARGHAVTGVDRDAAALAPLRPVAAGIVVADLEAAPWPLPGRRFDAVIVANYLWRDLFPALRESLAEGGVLIYETFAAGNERHGRPQRPDFLLRPGELLQACAGMRIVAYEDGFEPAPPRCVQRIAAIRTAPDGARDAPLAPPPGAGVPGG